MATTIVSSGFPVSSLYPDRYGCGKSKVYEALKELGIVAYRERKTAYITLEQLHRLDRYLIHGETSAMEASEAPAETWLAPSEQAAGRNTEAPETSALELSSLPPMMQLLVEAVAAQLTPTQPDPFYPQAQLQRLVEMSAVASTSQLKAIEINPVDGIAKYGYRISRVDSAIHKGREAGWRIAKLEACYSS